MQLHQGQILPQISKGGTEILSMSVQATGFDISS